MPELQLQNLDQTLCSKYMNKSLALWPNLSSQICNKLLPTRSSSSTSAIIPVWRSFELPSSHARVTLIKFAKRQWVSEWVSELLTRVNNEQWTMNNKINKRGTARYWKFLINHWLYIHSGFSKLVTKSNSCECALKI